MLEAREGRTPLVVVDAANVVGSVPNGWWRDRRGAVLRLRDQLAELAERALPPGVPEWAQTPPLEVVLVVEGAARDVESSDTVRVERAPRVGDDTICRDRPPRRGGSALFCVHHGYGMGWSYRQLLAHLPTDQPVYALQARSLSERDHLPASVTEMAADYLAHIRAIQPTGPYHLLGWSFGGLVAHEMAVQLQADGQQVATLALLDCYPDAPEPHEHQPEIDEAMVYSGIAETLQLGAQPAPAQPWTAQTLSTLLQERSDTAGLTAADVQAIAATMMHSDRLGRAHVPGRFDGDLLFFTATDQRPASAPTAGSWHDHLTGRVINTDVPCRHTEMMDPPALAQIAPILNRTLYPVAISVG